MPRLGAKQTLTAYAMVLCWSVFVFWVGFSFGGRTAPDPIEEEAADFSAKPSRAFPMERKLEGKAAFQGPPAEAAPAPPETPAAVQASSQDNDPATQTKTDEPAARMPVHTVQIAAVRTRTEGRELLGKLAARGYEGRVVPPSTSGGFYRVWVGEFEDEAAAHEMEQTLKDDGFSTYVRQAPDSFE